MSMRNRTLFVMTFAVATVTLAQGGADGSFKELQQEVGVDDSFEAQTPVKGHEVVQDNDVVQEAEVSAEALKRLELQTKADERDEIAAMVSEIHANKKALADASMKLRMAQDKLKSEQGAKTNAALSEVKIKIPKIAIDIALLGGGTALLSKSLAMAKNVRYMSGVHREMTPSLKVQASKATVYLAGGATAGGLGGANLLTDKKSHQAVLNLVREGNASVLVELGRMTTKDIEDAKLMLRDAVAKLSLAETQLKAKENSLVDRK